MSGHTGTSPPCAGWGHCMGGHAVYSFCWSWNSCEIQKPTIQNFISQQIKSVTDEFQFQPHLYADCTNHLQRSHFLMGAFLPQNGRRFRQERWISPLAVRFSQGKIHPFFHERGPISEALSNSLTVELMLAMKMVVPWKMRVSVMMLSWFNGPNLKLIWNLDDSFKKMKRPCWPCSVNTCTRIDLIC